jgi:hypothetical protein
MSAPTPLAFGRHVGDLAFGRMDDALDQCRQRLESTLHLVDVFVLIVALDDVTAAVTETLLGNVAVDASAGQ